MGIRHRPRARARHQGHPRLVGRGRLGARPDRPGDEPGDPRRLPQAAEAVSGTVSTPTERLAALGLELPEVAAPLAAYVPAVRSGSHVFTAGQLPLRSGEL